MTATIGTSDSTSDPLIRPATLVDLHKPGFKLVPLTSDHKPVSSWTPIYEDPYYWTPKGLVDNSSKLLGP